MHGCPDIGVAELPHDPATTRSMHSVADFNSGKFMTWLDAGVLCFDDVSLRALHECDYLIPFGLRHFKSLQRRINVPQKRRPIALRNLHPFMGDLHVSSGVVVRATCTGTQKINQQLLFPLYTVLSSMNPVA